MRRIWVFLLVLTCLLGLALTGCAGEGEPAPGAEGAAASADGEASSGEGAAISSGELEMEQIEPADSLAGQTGGGEVPGSIPDGDGGGEGAVDGGGKARIAYTGSRSAVRYITSPADLPDCEGLEAYDAAWFEDHALVLVTETVSSGSVQVGIASIDPESGAVTLSHEMSGDYGTGDMATWLLWAEVAPGLERVTWSVTNPALPSDTVAY